ncbi:Uncharacterized protein SCG7109_AZ_00050 [Chlamydiales bacterium SCGC AG-110-M15]|nr:Uncharacterized protein SCG7109_AZ_00050 [Chlamydiales bacterium SCGC AG-110-M15]
MKKEPIFLYLLKLSLSIGLFVVICLLYWSSLLIEQDLKDIKSDLSYLKKDGLSFQQSPHAQSPLSIASSNAPRPHIDPSLKNILNEDLFYTETLPNLLGEDFRPKGTIRIASYGKPESLHPFNGFREVSNMVSMCTVSTAGMEFGKYETMTDSSAIKIEERYSNNSNIPEFWVHLRDNIFWEPLEQRFFPDDLVLDKHFLTRHQVTAHDYKFYLDAIMNPHVQLAGAVSSRNYLGDIESLEVIDDLTLVVKWKTEKHTLPDGSTSETIKYTAKNWTGSLRPLPRFLYQYFPDGSKIIENDNDPDAYRKNSVWAQNFSQHWAKNIIPSCGPWIFDGFNEERALFRRNPRYFNPYAVLVERRELFFKESPDAMWQDFKSGKIDYYTLNADQLVELEEFLQSPEYLEQARNGKGINRVDYVSRAYNYVGWNQATALFSSAKVRRAMTMGIDRQRIIKQNLNGMGTEITGPFFIYSPSNDKNILPWPYDPDEARQMLQEDGWYDSDGDGTIDKMIDGKLVPFRFSLTYYVKNPNTKINAEYIATALNELGVDCQLNGVDITDLSNSFDEKSFDALYLGWALGTPPEEPKQLWHSQGANEKGSSNAVGFANKRADQIIEDLQYEYQLPKRHRLYHDFHQIVHESAPYTFLYTPKTVLLYRDYVQNVFIPADRQDLIPGANVPEPNSNVFWLKTNANHVAR